MLIDKSEHYTRFSKSIDIIGIDTETSEMDSVNIYPNITVYLIYNRILVCKLQDRRRSSLFTNFRKPIPDHVNIQVQYYTKHIVTRGIHTTYINDKCINI